MVHFVHIILLVFLFASCKLLFFIFVCFLSNFCSANELPIIVISKQFLNLFYRMKTNMWQVLVRWKLFGMWNDPSETWSFRFDGCGLYWAPTRPEVHARCFYLSKFHCYISMSLKTWEHCQNGTKLCRNHPRVALPNKCINKNPGSNGDYF